MCHALLGLLAALLATRQRQKQRAGQSTHANAQKAHCPIVPVALIYLVVQMRVRKEHGWAKHRLHTGRSTSWVGSRRGCLEHAVQGWVGVGSTKHTPTSTCCLQNKHYGSASQRASVSVHSRKSVTTFATEHRHSVQPCPHTH